MIGLKITGLEGLEKATVAMAKELGDEILAATIQNVYDVKGKAKEIAPYKTGTLRRSIDGSAGFEGGQHVGRVGSDLEYARILELGGTIPAHTVNVRSRKSLYSKEDKRFFGKRANIPAQYRAPRPYLFPALIMCYQNIIKRYALAVDRSANQAK